ncbi:B3 domain-containing protein Os02g0598200-like [Vicia villosa]|uniref:B3 domain-containing protein Os02g0598200-like n=1 Tax=Vicia villosa TaxID=3911 RepID=UPI00273AB6ED|nr:B3 domain-containing protein Os02g0598200-like [Vicia villosa]
MGRNPKVCTSCIHNCRMFHRPLPPTTTSPSSFYKFMLRQNDLKHLYLPPKLKRTMSGLVGKSFNLEDSSGGRWDVTLSNDDGSLAFKEGWDVFSLDHKLEVGDLVVFSSIDKLKFGVKIYDESVCERVDFSKTRIRKKRDRNGEFVRQDPNASLVDLQTDVPMQNQHTEIDLGETRNNVEDTCFITSNAYQNDLNKDPMVEEVLGTGDTSYASKLELHGKNNCPMERKSPDFILVESNERKSFTSNGEVQEGEGQFAAGLGSDHAAISRGKHALHAFELETSGRNNSLGESDKNAYEKTSILKHEEYKKGKSLLSEKEIPECSFAEGLGSRKKVPMNMTPKRRGSFNDKLHATELPKVVKGKLNQNNEGHFETVAPISCEVLKIMVAHA